MVHNFESTNTIRYQATVTRGRREQLNGHKGAIVWFTGLSGSGKSTVAHAVEEQLHQQGCRTYVLDGDNLRHGLCGDLGFSINDRHENIRRAGEVAKIFADAGMIVLTAFISPLGVDRDRVRRIAVSDFIEIYCCCPIEICEARDIKGLYKKARAGEIKDFTGIDSPYEIPDTPELVIDSVSMLVHENVATVIAYLQRRGIIALSER
jgi:adenylylsulfate kinase